MRRHSVCTYTHNDKHNETRKQNPSPSPTPSNALPIMSITHPDSATDAEAAGLRHKERVGLGCHLLGGLLRHLLGSLRG